ncbi:hypothetical protein C8Q80DRAFT_1273890 [Daedaleopsis nitida]|nr:hypothetical protein C8Q80DRAFT_1273890 [Daedaleopsis nitida]
MDALDLNWCLACGCRIELEVCTPYCSQSCLNSDQPSTSALPSYPTLSSLVPADRDSILDDDEDDLPHQHYDEYPLDEHLASPTRNAWAAHGGDARIRAWAQSIPSGMPSDLEETHSGTLKPKLLLQPRRPVKPSLCMSRAQPAPPEPSRPILTPQQSLPSLSRDSTSVPSTSMLSLTTGSSSYSVVTPATGSEIGSTRDAPIHRSQNFLGGLKAQLRAWTASSPSHKEATRSSTLTRKETVHIVDDSDSLSGRKMRRPASPPSFFVMPEQYSTIKRKEAGARTAAKENAQPGTTANRRAAGEDHPAYRARGRKTSRLAS